MAIEAGKFPIVLHGQAGSGKTCAAIAVACSWPCVVIDYSRYYSSGKHFHKPCDRQAFALKASEVIRRISFREGSGKVFHTMRNASLIVLDDVGVKDLTSAAADALVELLDARQGKPLIVTTNHNPLDMTAKIGDERVCSRLRAGGPFAWVAFPDTDLRTKQ